MIKNKSIKEMRDALERNGINTQYTADFDIFETYVRYNSLDDVSPGSLNRPATSDEVMLPTSPTNRVESDLNKSVVITMEENLDEDVVRLQADLEKRIRIIELKRELERLQIEEKKI